MSDCVPKAAENQSATPHICSPGTVVDAVRPHNFSLEVANRGKPLRQFLSEKLDSIRSLRSFRQPLILTLQRLLRSSMSANLNRIVSKSVSCSASLLELAPTLACITLTSFLILPISFFLRCEVRPNTRHLALQIAEARPSTLVSLDSTVSILASNSAIAPLPDLKITIRRGLPRIKTSRFFTPRKNNLLFRKKITQTIFINKIVSDGLRS